MLKRVSLWIAALTALVLLPVLGVSAASTPPVASQGARYQAPSQSTGGARFLTLPFNDPAIKVQNGWIYNTGYLHSGADYVLGQPDTGKWSSFDVVAAADGWACGNCTSRQGNAVWIKHVVNGQIYYTYYGHLASIDVGIPVGDQKNTVWVQRGQHIGMSGKTGADSVHLHFQVNLPSGPVDPYDLWSSREPYMPGCAQCDLGPNTLWATNPPSFSSGAQLASGGDGTGAANGGQGGSDDGTGGGGETLPTVRPTSTPRPRTPTATPRPSTPTASPTPSCQLAYAKTVEGNVSDASPEVRYCLAGEAGAWVSVRMFAKGGSSLDTLLKLYGPDGKLVAQDDDGAQVGGDSFLVQQLPKTGTYQLVATRYTGDGAYRLRVDRGAKSALGDLNSDCQVDSSDIGLMADALGSRDPDADLNLDGVVDAQDQQAQILRLGRGCTQPGK